MNNYVKIVAFDLETTGLEVHKDDIIEIGAIMFSVKESRGRMVPEKLGEFQSLIKAYRRVPPEATKINKITNEMLVNAPSCPEVLTKFKAFCDKANCLVAHNAPFDTRFASMAYGRHSVPAPTPLVIDSIKIARNIIALPSHALGALAKVFEARNEISLKVKDSSMHRAVYDCELLMHVLVALLRGRFDNDDWQAQEFMQALKQKDIHHDPLQIKPTPPKVSGFF